MRSSERLQTVRAKAHWRMVSPDHFALLRHITPEVSYWYQSRDCGGVWFQIQERALPRICGYRLKPLS